MRAQEREEVKRRYAVVYEWTGRNYSAYSPDVPGCISTGKTLEEIRASMHEALTAHLAWLADDGDPNPEATAVIDYDEIEIPVPAAAKS